MEENSSSLAGETQRYQLAECIGQGGLGAVYRAWDDRLHRQVAIKRLTNVSAFETDKIQAAMQREASALAALQHPNVVSVFDFGVDADGPFVVMEFIDGRTLDDCVDSAPFDAGSFLDLADQTLSGVGSAHRAGLLHRDLKPGNIMLMAGEGSAFQVKLLDFGLAKFAAQPSVQTLDQTDSLFGSIYFMAPEQFRRGLLDARTDLYALGCVFYFALTCRHPFTGETIAVTMGSHLQHTVRDLASLRPDLPLALSAWVMRLLSLAPEDRPNDAIEALAALRAIKRAGGDALPPGAGDSPDLRDGRSRTRLAMAGAAAAGLVALAVLGIWFGSRRTVLRSTVSATPAIAAPAAAVPVALPLVTLVADEPGVQFQGGAPGSFTLARSGDRRGPLQVSLQINGSAKNGIDYEKIAKVQTIAAGAAARKILIVPTGMVHAGEGKRHVRLTVLPADAYRVATVGEVKMNIVYEP